MLKRLIPTIFLLLLFSSHCALAYFNPGKPNGFINDYADALSLEQTRQLDSKLMAYEKETGNEISVAIIESLQGDTIENFAVELFKDWGIGKEGLNNGILLLIAKEDKEMRIEVGYGLEGSLTDAQSFWIISDILTPAFKEGDYYNGIDEAIGKIMLATKGEAIPSIEKQDQEAEGEIDFYVFLFSSIFIGLGAFLARTKSWWFGGVIGLFVGVVIGIVISSIEIGLVSALGLGLMGLLFDYFLSKNHKNNGSGGSIWTGRGGFGGGGRGGFGGFGGGISGGGGASGRW